MELRVQGVQDAADGAVVGLASLQSMVLDRDGGHEGSEREGGEGGDLGERKHIDDV